MYRKLILSLCLLFSVSSFLFCQMPNKTKANFQQDATELIEYAFSEVGSIPGISMSVVKDGKSVFEKGFGYANIETKLKMKTALVGNSSEADVVKEGNMLIRIVRATSLCWEYEFDHRRSKCSWRSLD